MKLTLNQIKKSNILVVQDDNSSLENKEIPYYVMRKTNSEFFHRNIFYAIEKIIFKNDEYIIDTVSYPINPQTFNETLNKETIMNPAKIIETKIFIFDDDANTFTDDQIFSKISDVEYQIEKMEKIKEKPKKLTAKIKKMKEAIVELITYVDERS